MSRRLEVGCAKIIPMDPDLDAEQLATFGNPEVEIGPDCEVEGSHIRS